MLGFVSDCVVTVGKLSFLEPGESHFLNVMMVEPKIVYVIDCSTDKTHKYVDNGVFFDGRRKTLEGYGKHQQLPAPTSGKKHYTEWMKE